MKTLAQAQVEILSHVGELEAEDAPLPTCTGQVLAEDVHSDYDLPMVDLCGPDGYAVRSEDVQGATPQDPVVLAIIGSNRAGYLPRHRLKPGTAVRVMTGSPVPAGADCVVPFEHTDEPGNKSGPNLSQPYQVVVLRPVGLGSGINRAGRNARKGSLVIPRGTVVGPAQISVLASIGKAEVRVFRRPRVAIISSGDELVGLKGRLRPGKAYDSNSIALATLVTRYGGIPRVRGIARDSEGSLTKKLRESLDADVILTSGGVSKGDYDLVRLVLDKMGRVVFSRLDTGPGGSFAFGLADREAEGGRPSSVPVCALAGPPAGSLINFETLVRPALLKMMGCAEPEHPMVEAVAADSVPEKKPMNFVKWSRLEYAPGGYRVALNLSESLGFTSAMAAGNSLTIIPKDTDVSVGDRLQVMPLDWTRW